jgi:hypothetical protein
LRRRLVFLTTLIALVAVLAAVPGAARISAYGGQEGATTSPVTFAVIGDYGMDDAHEAAVAALVKSWDPAYIITTGDDYYWAAGGTGSARYDESTGAYYGAWIKDFSTTGTRYPSSTAVVNAFFPSLGNHDWVDATPAPETYLAYFDLPGAGFANSSGNERYYDYVEGDVHFFVLDSCPQEPDGNESTSTQATWLRTQLAASTSAWNIVYDHHPPYSSDSVHGSATPLQWPFAAWGADAVVSGHAHTYERVERDGIVYFVNGLGGATRYDFATPVAGSVVRYSADWGAQKVTVGDTWMIFDLYNVAGALIDTYTIRDTPAVPKALTATAASSSRIDLAWTDNAGNEDGFKVERAADGSAWTQIATVGAGVASFGDTGLEATTTYSYRVRAFNALGDSAYSVEASATTAVPALHIGDLDGARTVRRTAWRATVTIAVHDEDHAPVAGAGVTGTWSGGATGSAAATTGPDGTCTVSRQNLKPALRRVRFTVTGVSKSGYAYTPAANHDPDGGSTGTRITVTK